MSNNCHQLFIFIEIYKKESFEHKTTSSHLQGAYYMIYTKGLRELKRLSLADQKSQKCTDISTTIFEKFGEQCPRSPFWTRATASLLIPYPNAHSESSGFASSRHGIPQRYQSTGTDYLANSLVRPFAAF